MASRFCEVQPALSGGTESKMEDFTTPGVPRGSEQDQGLPIQTQSHPKSSSGPKLATKEAAAKLKAKTEEKDAWRRQKAIDKRIAMAKREAEKRRG